VPVLYISGRDELQLAPRRHLFYPQAAPGKGDRKVSHVFTVGRNASAEGVSVRRLHHLHFAEERSRFFYGRQPFVGQSRNADNQNQTGKRRCSAYLVSPDLTD